MKSLSAQVQDMVAVIDQLLAARKTKDIAIVLCINIDSNLVPSNFPRGTNRPSAGFTTLFYSIEIAQNSLTLISENPKFDILDEASVTFFFKDIVQDNFPAEQYALFTWDHGQPFGIFGGSDEAPLIVNSKNPLPLYFKLYNTFPALKHKARQFLTESDVQILTITELRNAIASSFSGKKIGVIAMSNCYLQFFDTGYELSSCAEYLVAFETLMYFADTFNYKTILEAISRNPYISSESLSGLIVSTFSYETDPIVRTSIECCFQTSAIYGSTDISNVSMRISPRMVWIRRFVCRNSFRLKSKCDDKTFSIVGKFHIRCGCRQILKGAKFYSSLHNNMIMLYE